MYLGNVSDFFYKNKLWLVNQPKITNENKYHYFEIGGKIFQLDIFYGFINEIDKNDKTYIFRKSLKAKRSNTHGNLKIDTIKTNKYKNLKFYIKNKKEKDINFSKSNKIIDKSSEKNKKAQSFKKYKSSNINHNFTLSRQYFFRNENTNKEFANLYLNKKYLLTLDVKKYIKNKNNFKKNNFLTLDNNQVSHKIRRESIPFFNINNKETIHSNDDQDNIFINEDMCTIEKGDNGLVKSVKDEIFKDRMFKILQKKYNFYNDNTNNSLNIPKLNLRTAEKIHFEKKLSGIQKLYINKTAREKNKILMEFKQNK